VLVAPLSETGEGDVEVTPLSREPVLEPLRALAVAHLLQDALLHQAVQAVGENVTGDAEALLELVEAAEPEERVADNQQRPALADDLERPGDRAVLALVVAVEQSLKVP
jgi:hypothetical protein